MKFISSLIFLLVIVACKDSNKIPDNFDYGEVKNGVYTNKYLNFDFRSPQGWAIQSKEQLKAVMNEGQKMIEKNNKDLGQQIKAADVRSAGLFAAFKYPTDSFTGKFNSSVSIAIENVSGVRTVKSGKDYLMSARSMMERSGIEYTFGDYTKETIGNKEFDVLKTNVTMQHVPLKQRYYVTLIKGFALVVITTFQDDSEEAEFDDILKGFKFN